MTKPKSGRELELKPCLCGMHAIVFEPSEFSDRFIVECSSDNSCMSIYAVSLNEAINLWNRRNRRADDKGGRG